MLAKIKPILFVLFIISCSGQKNANQSGIEIINDTKQVAQLRKSIVVRIKRQMEAEAKKRSLADVYKSGDKSVVPVIINVLKSNDKSKKAALLQGLGKKMDDADNYAITEPAIIQLILNDVDNPLFEEDAIQLAGYNKIPGYQNKFESRLLSGNSTDAGRLFFWLGQDGKSVKAFEYISKQIRDDKVTQQDLEGILPGLKYYGENGNASAVGALALTIYQKKLISNERFEALKKAAHFSDCAEDLLSCLFEYGDSQVIPIAKDILERKIEIEDPIKALIRLEGPQHLKKIYPYLENEDTFYKGVEIVESIDGKLVDDAMLKEILIQFPKQKTIADYEITRIVRLFIHLNATDYLKNIADTELANKIKRSLAVNNISPNVILHDLLRTGLIAAMPDTAVIRKETKEAAGNPFSFMYGILEAQKAYTYFDMEANIIPVEYDKLLRSFSDNSNGLLKDMKVWMDAENNNYVITVVYKEQAFIARPKNVGDWYDVTTVNALLDVLMEKSGSDKRFVPIDSDGQLAQYILGTPAAVKEVLKKYDEDVN